jgi:hypothetical protein
MQIQTKKILNQFDFLTTSIYERYDLRDRLKKGEKFVIRQGDLIITNFPITNIIDKGLRHAYIDHDTTNTNNIGIFRNSHLVYALSDSTILFHNEHGLVIIPEKEENLNLYVFDNAVD